MTILPEIPFSTPKRRHLDQPSACIGLRERHLALDAQRPVEIGLQSHRSDYTPIELRSRDEQQNVERKSSGSGLRKASPKRGKVPCVSRRPYFDRLCRYLERLRRGGRGKEGVPVVRQAPEYGPFGTTNVLADFTFLLTGRYWVSLPNCSQHEDAWRPRYLRNLAPVRRSRLPRP